MTKHSIETIIGILAVIKLDAIYVPIDIMYPVDIIKYIIEDSELSYIFINIVPDQLIEFKGKFI